MFRKHYRMEEALGNRVGLRLLRNHRMFCIITRPTEDSPWDWVSDHAIEEFPLADRLYGPYSFPEVVCFILGAENPAGLSALRKTLSTCGGA